MVRGGSLLILRFVGQRSRSQLLKIEQFFYTFFVSTRYLKNEMSDLNETWYAHACLMVRGGGLLIMRFVGQRSRSQLLKREQKLNTFFVSARYLKNEMSDLNESWYTHD
jgi:hypothetical protein